MKPSGIFLFYAVILLSLGGIMVIFPEDGIRIGDEFAFSFPSTQEVFGRDSVKKKNADEIFDKLEKDLKSEVITVADSTFSEVEFIAYLEDSIHKSHLKIQYPDANKSVLHPFFSILENAWGYKEPIRVLHYGDSQLEGDRISSYIRSNLQTQFGGSGPGLVPAFQTVPSFSVWQDNSPNWQRFSAFGRRGPSVGHKRFGVMANFTRFGPAPEEGKEEVEYQGWLRLHQTKSSYVKSRVYKKLKMYYGHNSQPVNMLVFADGQLIMSDSLPANHSLQAKTLTFQKTPHEVTINFSGKDSPEFYGISLESDRGIMVDNIALRGSAGTIFTSLDSKLLKDTYDSLNVKMILLQFGGNAVPHLKSMKSVIQYGESFKRQIAHLKRLAPGASFIVIGPADMSTKDKTEFVTYPYVEEVRDVMKKAAFESGAAFYDIYEIMGGRNSMPAWVKANPPLAGPDYIHFTPRGAKKVAELFYESLMEDYEEFKENKRTAIK